MNVCTSRSARLVVVGALGALAFAAVAVVPSAAGAAPDASVTLARGRAGTVTRVETQLELRRAVAKANLRDGLDRIDLTRSVSLSKGNGKGSGALTLDLDVTDDLILNGGGNAINGRNLDRVLDVARGARLELKNLTLRGGSPAAAGEGGGLLRITGGQARLRRVILTGGRAGGAGAAGGAVLNRGGRLVLVASSVEDSEASVGAGIAASGGVSVLRRTVVEGNVAAGADGVGGGLHVEGGRATLVDVTATGNSAAEAGGGLWADTGSVVTVRDSRVDDNTANLGPGARGGGGIYYGDTTPEGSAADGRLLVVGSSVSRNNTVNFGSGPSEGAGGGLLVEHGTVALRDSTVADNTSLFFGGGVQAEDTSLTLEDVDVTGNRTLFLNRSGGAGGGILVGGGTATISGGSVRNNEAARGGGILNAATTTLTGVTLAGNSATQSGEGTGGGAVSNSGTLTVEASTFVDNAATGARSSGGGVLNESGGVLRVSGSTFRANAAVTAGGAVAADGGTMDLVDSDLEGNTVATRFGEGGGLQADGTSVVTVQGGRITGGAAAVGGGLWNSSFGSTLEVTGAAIVDNTATTSPNAHQDGDVAGAFTIDGQVVPTGDNRADYP